MPAAAAAPPGMPAFSKRVRGTTAERVPLQLRVLLRVGVLIGVEVLVEGGSVVAQAAIVRVRSYIDISNIHIINTRILYLLSGYLSWIISRS